MSLFELLEIVENAVEERNWKDKFSMSKTKEGKGVIMIMDVFVGVFVARNEFTNHPQG
jgi:hypothetical protein